MYADDTHITFAINNIQNINTVLNEDLARVEKWLTADKLTLNASKTEFMSIGSRQRPSQKAKNKHETYFDSSGIN